MTDEELGTLTLTPSAATWPSRAEVEIVAPALAVGTRIGRYIVRERVGAGGMGEVYEAFDPELDRSLAIKLVHPRAARDADEQRMLIAEAQALAQLNHPNVVQVYDAGTFEGRVFVAMEMVEGRTLQSWLRSRTRERSWREIVQLFVQIGRGLAAAHAAGIVHGDFKPSNVMMPREPDGAGLGRPRVFDFGLSRPVGSMSISDQGSPEVPAPIVRGTPGFMAPEQFRGAALMPATDQFAFCVALYEALWDQRPFSGDTLAQLQREVQGGTVRVPSDAGMPSRLRRAVLRGLRVDPGARHESMDALLAELQRVLGRRRFALAVGTTILVGAGLAGVAIARSEASTVCDAGAERAESVWNDARREALDTGLRGVGKAYAVDASERLLPMIDDYVGRWVDVHRGTCELGRAGDDAKLDQTMACLEDALFELDASLDVITKSDAGVARNAIAMFEALPSPSRCAETGGAVRSGDENGDEALALREQLAIARARSRAARFDEAIAILQDVVARAEALQLVRLVAVARLSLAEAVEISGKPGDAEPIYNQAIADAATAHDERAEAGAWIQLVRLAAGRADLDAAERYRRQAEASLQRLGEDPELEVQLHTNIGVLAMGKGEVDVAREEFATALPVAERLMSPADPRVAGLLNNLGATYGIRGDHARALEYFRRAEQLKRDAMGPMHPDVATCLLNVSVTYDQLGDSQRAYEVMLEVLRVRESAYGPDHAEVGTAYHNLGTMQAHLGHLEEALALFEKALVIRNATIGPEHPSTALTENNIGDSLTRSGRPREALPHIERARDVLERKVGPDHPYVAFALYSLGEAKLALGEPAEAIAPIERALALRETKKLDPLELARTKLTLARALMAAGRDRDRALVLARTAVAEYRTLGPRSDDWLADAEKWLAKYDRAK